KSVKRIAGLDLVAGSQGRLKVYLVVFFILLSVLAGALIVTVIRTSRLREELKEFKGDTNALVEGKIVEDRPKLEGKK
ncbi:MAG: hypothetical protein HYU98_02150, partial [Deltaproteobacteria bacterium]|nr:hypothetical protein [Deltaproteobacteria bacterium]